VRSALDASGRLVLELTQSVLLEDFEVALERLHALKGLGVRLALDDFGTGFSSLSYLSRLPVDILKLDRSFLLDGTPALIAGIVGLGAALQIAVVAEGIETKISGMRCQLSAATTGRVSCSPARPHARTPARSTLPRR
jgi:EAL domain-containing protein (putative c-di-GMP-specific phosphodiesterase class I)